MKSSTNSSGIDYDDKRLTDVESNRSAALAENEKMYDDMAAGADKFYSEQINATKEYADTQQKLQQEQTDFAIEQIEQQKEQAKKDYQKEQSGAYVDWQKQSNNYGANAEVLASNGLDNTGYSESSQVSMYNTYQNRVATARESYNLAVQNYNNAITEARLQNNSVLAEIAYNSLQQQLQIGLQGFQYQNTLLTEKINQKNQINTRFDSKYQAVLDQINKENSMQEEMRQFNLNYELQEDKLKEDIRQYNTNLAEEQRQYNSNLAEEKRQYNNTSSAKITDSGDSVIDKKTSSTFSEDATMKSIRALGFGNISAEKLDQLVREGKVEEYTKNGVTLFRKVPTFEQRGINRLKNAFKMK